MNPITKLQQMLPKLTNKEQLIAEYILKDPSVIIKAPAETIAKNAHASKSAFIRMCQKLGFAGYAEFRFACSSCIFSNTEQSIVETGDPIKNIVANYANHILEIAEMLDYKTLDKVTDIILAADRVRSYGFNRTRLSSLQLQMRGAKLGFDFDSIIDKVVFFDIIPTLKKNDVCLYFSTLAAPKEHRDLTTMLKNVDCQSILFTMSTSSPMLSAFDHVITLPSILNSTSLTFLDNQTIFFVFIEILLNDLARKISQKEEILL